MCQLPKVFEFLLFFAGFMAITLLSVGVMLWYLHGMRPPKWFREWNEDEDMEKEAQRIAKKTLDKYRVK